MLVLALDTATPASTAALVEVTADGLFGVAESRTVDPRAHGEKLAPEIAAVLAEAGLRPRDLGAIVAGLGPGPFTGLRVGLATAASMGQALGIPAYGVCSLDALGRAAGPGRVLIATDARRREVYYGTYADGVRETGPDVAKPADVTINADRAAGEGALKYGDVFGLPVEEHLLYPPGAALVAIAADRIRAGAPGEILTPLYLRRPDAVEPAGRKPVLT
ncbi:tRNA (adenosine(37)-N6)-threonylcarbamoyltransferase complex dimerization subunit type 1 TsaB [Actinoplanes ianthinogenes]|uniref:tRNA (Adenosine(37)-N6)-threonylcarbamoyltransferase complex dimerization subunit type 1 TsaB n=1 Tax=Actinoplanes ianthinogenes TaxID=122358 RepID=A0ABM7LYF8_9ACTN|nr:tRNA (adenosine(37)-N6)-threonylcarbamoyltransferase complex dimerization subunit type 1 TsaB [Actinoplanes ianthinogenes]BCJ44353.1 tRNA (adenosine(37)-N6)-threonylcarbamoyltransferase complex dimerization subunit type 1 TsaB [Actinoplanes ianthinogenes]GGQ97460.1 tRNA (adenosine(37)-N6)-threonylcarbamoyltransferase complex dimerization subunit type 1 TsaB [Actinoplanes ianthinogenes]